MGRVKGLVVVGDDPVGLLPDAAAARETLQQLDFLLVHDTFLTQTAELADVVLPAASFAEQDGTFTSAECRVQRVRTALEPAAQARPQWQVLCEIARRLGYEMEYAGAEQIMEEIGRANDSYAGISYARLEDGFGLLWPLASRGEVAAGAAVGEGRIFAAPSSAPEMERPDPEYPFVLVVDHVSFGWHSDAALMNSGILAREYSIPMRDFPDGFVEVNSEDCAELKVRRGAPLRLVSKHGEMTLRAAPSAAPRRKTLHLPYHLRERVLPLFGGLHQGPGGPAFPPLPVRLET